MKLALCGYPPFAEQLRASLQGVEFKYFIGDFISARGGGNFNLTLPPISFFDFRRLINAGELDGIIIAEEGNSIFAREVARVCKFYGIPKVGIMNLISFNPEIPVHWLAPEKTYLMQLEVNIIDGCNLNCKGCTHYAGLFKTDEFYPIETFKRDIRQLSQVCDVATFFLLGGEPLLLKNLGEYIKISRQYLQEGTDFRLLTNGLLLPSLSPKVFEVIRENNFTVEISVYPPTKKILNEIKATLSDNGIKFRLRGEDSAENVFNAFLTLHAGKDPLKSRAVCCNDGCRFLRDGKIYKCPIDALSYKFVEKFGLKNYPKATGVDIYSPNFSSLIEMLDGNVEMCGWCAEQVRKILWEPSKKPKLEDWLADPAEAKALR